MSPPLKKITSRKYNIYFPLNMFPALQKTFSCLFCGLFYPFLISFSFHGPIDTLSVLCSIFFLNRKHLSFFTSILTISIGINFKMLFCHHITDHRNSEIIQSNCVFTAEIFPHPWNPFSSSAFYSKTQAFLSMNKFSFP